MGFVFGPTCCTPMMYDSIILCDSCACVPEWLDEQAEYSIGGSHPCDIITTVSRRSGSITCCMGDLLLADHALRDVLSLRLTWKTRLALTKGPSLRSRVC